MKALLLAAHHGELQKVRDLVHKLVEIDFADEVSYWFMLPNSCFLFLPSKWLFFDYLLRKNFFVSLFSEFDVILFILYHLQHGMTALHYAANAGHLGVVETLLVAKADVHAIDEVREMLRCVRVSFISVLS